MVNSKDPFVQFQRRLHQWFIYSECSRWFSSEMCELLYDKLAPILQNFDQFICSFSIGVLIAS